MEDQDQDQDPATKNDEEGGPTSNRSGQEAHGLHDAVSRTFLQTAVGGYFATHVQQLGGPPDPETRTPEVREPETPEMPQTPQSSSAQETQRDQDPDRPLADRKDGDGEPTDTLSALEAGGYTIQYRAIYYHPLCGFFATVVQQPESSPDPKNQSTSDDQVPQKSQTSPRPTPLTRSRFDRLSGGGAAPVAT
jgi:hypothetical protein